MGLPSGPYWVEKEELEGKSFHLVPGWWERGEMGVGGGALGISEVALGEGSVSEDEEASSSQESAIGLEVDLGRCGGLEDRERFLSEESRP